MAATRGVRPPAGAAAEPDSGAGALATYAPHVERTRCSLLRRLTDAPAAQVVRPYFERGKMLRAYLVFASASAVGGEPSSVAMAAEAIELLHGASLFHDDIIDCAAERRGLPSLHERIGVGPALVVGDYLLLHAFAVLAEARECHPLPRVLEATDTLNDLARRCCRGQFDELGAGPWIPEEEYLAIVRGKTAAPFVGAGVLGALLGGGDGAGVACIRQYAEALGVAFQIGDDLLDLVGQPGALGKPAGNSLDRGRPLLPLIYLRAGAAAEAQAGSPAPLEDAVDRPEIVRLLTERGILDRVRDVQRVHYERALEALTGLPNAAAAEALRMLAARAVSAAP